MTFSSFVVLWMIFLDAVYFTGVEHKLSGQDFRAGVSRVASRHSVPLPLRQEAGRCVFIQVRVHRRET